MKPLWTPWRMDYIQGKTKPEKCFLDAARGKRHDKENLMLYRDRETVVFLNRYPYSNGHLLIAPARHISDITDLDTAEHTSLMKLIRHSVVILRKNFHPDGFNIGLNLGKTAGAGVSEHLHFHVVPRWDGDHNFLAVLAETRTIPQHIDATFDQILPAFESLQDSAGQPA